MWFDETWFDEMDVTRVKPYYNNNYNSKHNINNKHNIESIFNDSCSIKKLIQRILFLIFKCFFFHLIQGVNELKASRHPQLYWVIYRKGDGIKMWFRKLFWPNLVLTKIIIDMLGNAYGIQCTWSDEDIQCRTRHIWLNMSKNYHFKYDNMHIDSY